MRGHHADPGSCDRPAADPAERLFCDGRDCAGLGAPGPAAADGGGGQYRRGCGARAKGRSLASAGDRADRDHDHRGPPRQLRRGDARRGSAELSRRVSRLSRPLRARDQHGDRRARDFLFLADPGRAGAEARRDDPPGGDRRFTGAVHARPRTDRRADRVAVEHDNGPVVASAAATRRARARHRPGNRLYVARGGCDRSHLAGRDRDRRDGAPARGTPGQRCHDAAHPDRVSRSR